MEKQSTRKFLKLIVALVALFLLGASALMLASCNKDEHQHSYTSSVTTPATCSNPGVETFTCSCGYAYTQIIPATGDHDWQVLQVYPNSCESDGYTVYECSVCHEQKQGDWTPKLDHQYEAVETVEETCTKDGYQIMQCSYCGDRYTDDQYSSEHKATGHKWIVNESPADPADLTDAEGWKVVSPADCLNAAQLQRTCSVCGDTEEKTGTAATGHKVLDTDGKTLINYHDVCKVNTSLIDAEGNKIYAYECVNENCPVEVVVDARGNTKHYIEAEEHTMKLDTTATNYKPATCEAGGTDTYKCSVCGETEEVKTEATGHAWNTVQADGKKPVVVCEADTKLATRGDYLAYMRSVVGNSTYLAKAGDYIAKWNAAFGTTGTPTDESKLSISRVCSKCGEVTVANGHKSILAKYVDGSSSVIEVDEETGLPVDYTKEVTGTAITCRYVYACANCGKVLERIPHKNVSAATCREPGVCKDCGVAVDQQLKHTWVNVAAILKYEKDGTAIDASSTIKDADLLAAYKKVSATETWMVPVTGSCDSKSTTVTVCAQCLLDAAKGTEVTWNQATEGKPVDVATSTNAYVITAAFTHDYQPVYFDLKTGEEMDYEDTNCNIGFMVKYVCTKCGTVYTNVPVVNAPVEEGKTDSVNEALANQEGIAYTDADGFVINDTVTVKINGTDTEINFNSPNFNADAFKLITKDDNKGEHKLYLKADYAESNGYTAATCISAAKVPFYCEYCGTIETLTAAQTMDDKAGYYDLELNDEDASSDDSIVKLTSDDWDLSKTNHAGTVYPCGVHCDAKTADGTLCAAIGKETYTSHDAVTIKYEFAADIANYYSNYSIQVAKVTTELIDEKEPAADINNHVMTLLDGTKIAACSAKVDNNNVFVAPQLWNTTEETAKAASGDYLVLVDNETKAVYAVVGSYDSTTPSNDTVKYYTENDTDSTPVSSETIVQSDDTYFINFAAGNAVTAAPVSASDAKSLALALQNEPETVKENGVDRTVLTVEVSKSFEIKKADSSVESDPTTYDTFAEYIDQIDDSIYRVVFELNGNTITFPDGSFENKYNSAVLLQGKDPDNWVFQNGTLDFKGQATDDAFVVGTVTTLTLNNVDVKTTGNGIRMNQAGATLNVNNSDLYVKGTYGIYTANPAGSSAAQTPANAVEINVTDSHIVMNYSDVTMATATATETTGNNVALYVDNFADVTVSGSTLSANRQVIVARSGEVNVSNTTLTIVDGYVSKSTLDTTGDNDGLNTDEDYYMAGQWGAMNEVPHAALVIGDSAKAGAEVYIDAANVADDTFATVIFGAGVVINVPTSGTYDVVIGSGYKLADLQNHEDYSKNTTTGVETLPITAYFNANGLVDASDIEYCWNVANDGLTSTIRLVGVANLN